MQTAIQIVMIAIGSILTHVVYKRVIEQLDKEDHTEEMQRILSYKNLCNTIMQFESFESPTIETCKPGSLWHNVPDHINYYYDENSWTPMDFDLNCCGDEDNGDFALGFYNCPNCGAPVSNHSHCEYCGTIFK